MAKEQFRTSMLQSRERLHSSFVSIVNAHAALIHIHHVSYFNVRILWKGHANNINRYIQLIFQVLLQAEDGQKRHGGLSELYQQIQVAFFGRVPIRVRAEVGNFGYGVSFCYFCYCCAYLVVG